MQDFRNLQVWQNAHELTLHVYRGTNGFPDEEKFGLTSQLRRSASSIGANLAEGCGRGSDRDMGRFLQIAMGSASETEYHLLLAHDLGYLNADDYHELVAQVNRIKRMLTALIKKLTP